MTTELHDILPEPPLDDLVHLARYICQAQTALIALMERDRQWVSSTTDVTEAHRAHLLDLSAQRIRGELIVVPDLRADQQWATNPLVAGEPHIRFYCGVPLTTPDGRRLGTLSIVDQVPRQLSKDQLDAIRALGRQVLDRLVLNHRDRELAVAVEAQYQAEQILLASEGRLQAILENSPLVVYIKDRNGRYMLVNREFDQRLGFSNGHAIGKTDAELFSPGMAALFQAKDQEVLQTKVPVQFVEKVRYLGGQHTGLVVKFPLLGPQKDVDAIGGIIMDITEHAAAEEALRVSEERFQLVAEVTNDVLWDWDLKTDKYWWSPNARSLFGYDPSLDPSSKAWSERLHPDDRQQVLREMDEAIRSGKREYVGECRVSLADGAYRFFVNKGQIVYDAQGEPVRMVGAMVDVTSTKMAYQSLTTAYERVQDMGRDLQMAEENERRRLSRELHDEFGQILSALKLHIARATDEVFRQGIENSSMLGTHVANAGRAADQLFASLREMIHGLRPAVLEELGLVAALEERSGELRESGIQCLVSADRDDFGSLLGVELEGALYRIGQELLTNVLRHAKATVATMTIGSANGNVTLTVRDNGRGFPTGFTLPKDRFGLLGVRERVALLGGRLDVQSESGRGTTVTVEFPIASTAAVQSPDDSSEFVVRISGRKRRSHGK
jgi:PAS domain S-box-containing protein